MVKERQILPVTSNRNRVSPYPLRSCRSKKGKEAESPSESPSESASVSEWEDVKCVICMEPPHNAVLLQCSSFAKGCRAYMCDTSARHSNCFKQYRRNNKNNTRHCNGAKTLICPYCRGEVNGLQKSTSARRFMNARPRCCSMDKCDFSGTYSQLKTHLKAWHPGFTPPEIDSTWAQYISEQLGREAEYIEMLNALERWEAEQRWLANSLQLQYRHPMNDLNFDAFMHNVFLGVSMESRARSQVSTSNYLAQMPRVELHAPIYPRWTYVGFPPHTAPLWTEETQVPSA